MAVLVVSRQVRQRGGPGFLAWSPRTAAVPLCFMTTSGSRCHSFSRAGALGSEEGRYQNRFVRGTFMCHGRFCGSRPHWIAVVVVAQDGCSPELHEGGLRCTRRQRKGGDVSLRAKPRALSDLDCLKAEHRSMGVVLYFDICLRSRRPASCALGFRVYE